jgi:hypothetical protein
MLFMVSGFYNVIEIFTSSKTVTFKKVTFFQWFMIPIFST